MGKTAPVSAVFSQNKGSMGGAENLLLHSLQPGGYGTAYMDEDGGDTEKDKDREENEKKGGRRKQADRMAPAPIAGVFLFFTLTGNGAQQIFPEELHRLPRPPLSRPFAILIPPHGDGHFPPRNVLVIKQLAGM